MRSFYARVESTNELRFYQRALTPRCGAALVQQQFPQCATRGDEVRRLGLFDQLIIETSAGRAQVFRDLQKCINDPRVELRALFSAQINAHLIVRQRLSPRPIVRQRVVGISRMHDSRFERNILTRQPSGVPLPSNRS